MEGFLTLTDEAGQKKERIRARQLRTSQWWKRKRSTGICRYCKQRFFPKDLTMDHVIPLCRGGKTEKFNLVACCKECNTKKRKLLPSEWEEYMATLK